MEKVLLVTGASSDIGIELVKKIGSEYGMIYLQYRTMNERLEHLIQELEQTTQVVPLKADLLKLDEVRGVIKAIEDNGVFPNHFVHLPAQKAYNKQFHKDQWENFEQGWTISVRSISEILKVFIPRMVKQRYGRIVLMLTSCTHERPPKYQSSYVTVKYALLGLMKALAVEYADKGITVNGISPDMMETKFLSELPELIVMKNREKSPLGRNVSVDEVLPVIMYMLSDVGGAITGQNIVISGGI